MVSTEYKAPEYGRLSFNTNTAPADILFARSSNMQEVVRIAHDGSIFWRGRLVESDDEFKQAMLDLAQCFKTNMWQNREEQ